MSLHPRPNDRIPDETARIARAAFRKGNMYLRLRDELGMLFDDEAFGGQFSLSGQSAYSPGRLALVTLMQFVENLTDRQAADAVRARLDWKYALGLEVTDEGFDFSVLSEFRARLLAHGAEEQLLNTLLAACRDRGWVKAGGTQRTDSTHVLAAVRALNRLECVGETLRHALEVLSDAAPAWLRAWLPPAWALRYAQPLDSFRLPKERAAQLALGQTIGLDGWTLLSRVYAPDAPDWLRRVPAVETLRQVWVQQYEVRDGQVAWRAVADLPPAGVLIGSPFDPEARTSSKRSMTWNGYQVHLTETCDPDTPHLVTQVLTTPATVPDVAMLPQVHDALAAKGLSPQVHVVDAGYTDAAELAHAAAAHQIEVLGPVRGNTTPQGHADAGYTVSAFRIDWVAQQVTCPQGQRSQSWTPDHDRHGNRRINVKFATAACRACPARAVCTRGAEGVRRLTFQPEAEYRALQAARAYQRTEAFKTRYRQRAGIEGTLAQGVAVFGLRLARYWGLAKTRLQHLLIAAAIDYLRMAGWLMGVPRASTRPSKLLAFAVVAPL